MRTVLLANNRLGAMVGRYLAGRDELVGLVVHPVARQRHGDELAGLDVPTWIWPDGLDQAAATHPECLFSALFGYVLDERWLRLPSWAAVNVHPGLLPWNKGAAPNVWPLVDGSPAGTTLHLMDEGLDTGALLAQRPVATRPDDTAATLYRRLEAASMELIEEVWPSITTIEPTGQTGDGSHHRMADLDGLDLRADELAVIDKLRARTFAPYGAEFERDGRRWRARIEIEPVDP